MWGIIQAMELTVVGKLDLSAQDKERLERTLELFADACNAISQVAFTERCFNSVALHHLTYQDIRQRFNLHANYTARARERAARESCRPSGLGRYWAAVNQPQAESGQPALSKLSALAVSS
jgi:predicted transposase